MIKILRYLLLSSAIMVFCTSLMAQDKLKQADKQFELFNYIKAIDLYEQAYQKNNNLHAAAQLAKAYSFTNNYIQAESWAAIAVGLDAKNAANVLLHAQALQQNAKYSQAKTTYQSYINMQADVDPRQQQLWLASCDSALKWMRTPQKIEILNQKTFNSSQSDWGAVNYQNSTVFSSDRKDVVKDSKKGRPFLRFDGTVWPDKNVYGWTGNGYLKLYVKNTPADSLMLFPIQAGTNYHVGPPSFTADGKTMFFTLTRIPANLKRLKKQPSTINVEVYSSTKDDSGNWGKPQAFVFNNVNNYSISDPFITANGARLYFSSNMPGGQGGSDIYFCEINNGNFSKPINFKEVNTAGNERSPVAVADGDFYFASDGLVGMGGLDIFKATLTNAQVANIENLKYPINSPRDDFGFSLDNEGNILFLSSDRTDGLGQDDIYSLKIPTVIKLALIGKVLDINTKQPIANALVVLSQKDGGILKVETDHTGSFNFKLNTEADYTLAGMKTGSLADVKQLNTLGLNSSTVIEKNLFLETIVLNKSIKIENIYYDFDQSNIRPDAALELDKLVKVLKDNPTIWIELGSHTDSRGKDAYNLGLSQRRANSAVAYIISNGINSNRVTARGYGETQLTNGCANGAACSEEEHQANRRTEFKIVKF